MTVALIALAILGLVTLVGYIGFKHLKKRLNRFVERWEEIDIPPGYKFVSMNDDVYIIENSQGRQEIVYFRKNND
jgi:hypothetical protein